MLFFQIDLLNSHSYIYILYTVHQNCTYEYILAGYIFGIRGVCWKPFPFASLAAPGTSTSKGQCHERAESTCTASGTPRRRELDAGCMMKWVCLKMLCTPKPNGFADHYPY